jgi:hypothetical protein
MDEVLTELTLEKLMTIADTDTAPWMNYNEKSFVEMNFMLEGHILQTHEGLLDRYHYRKGSHNILFNPYMLETNQSVWAERVCARSGRKVETG